MHILYTLFFQNLVMKMLIFESEAAFSTTQDLFLVINAFWSHTSPAYVVNKIE